MQLKQAVLHLLLTVFLSLSFHLGAQNQISSEAEIKYRNGLYQEARKLYSEVLRDFPANAIYNHRYGVSVYETNGDNALAEKHLELAAKKGIRLSNYYLAKVKFRQYKFDEAIELFKKFKSYIRRNDPRQEEIKQQIERCEEGKSMLQHVEDIEVTDTLIVPFDMFYKHYNMSHETGSFSNVTEDGSSSSDSLYLLYLPEKADRSFFSEFVNATQKRDIFRTDKLLDTWSEPKAIEPLNTESNEIYPYLMSDGLTMYFCSDRPSSFGGFDIFITRYNPSINNFLPPQPVGMPFNSYGNDYLYVIDEFRNVGWFASDRHNEKGFVTIYRFIPNETKKIVQTEDAGALRMAALLKSTSSEPGSVVASEVDTSQKSDSIREPAFTEDTGNINITPKKEKPITFIVNDTIVYKKLSDFKNRDAITTFQSYLNCKSKTDSLSSAIEDYRIEYESEIDESQRRTLTKQILNSEEKLQSFQSKLDSLEQRTRKLELDAVEAYLNMQNEDETYLAPWKPKPFEIKIPKHLTPTFYQPYLQENYSDIFTATEIKQLQKVEYDKLTADNLVLDWQEILMKLNKDPEADRIIVEKLIERDSAFAEPMTREQLVKISENLRNESTTYYYKALTGKYNILRNKSMFLNRLASSTAIAKSMRKMQQEAEFQYYNASSKTNNFTDYKNLTFDEIQQSTGFVEKSLDILEREIILYDKSKKALANTTPAETKTISAAPLKVTYKVQIGIFKHKPSESALSKLNTVSTEPVEGTDLIRYYTGEYNNRGKADLEAKIAESAGFPGAFIVPFINGTKSSWEEVQKLNSK